MSFDWQTWNEYIGSYKWLRRATIFVTRHGSHAYGTNIAGSDEDFKGICIAPMYYRLGNLHHFEDTDKGFGETDCIIYDVKKVFELLSKCNPNIIEVLFTDPSDWVYPEKKHLDFRFNGKDMIPEVRAFKKIYDNREMFLTKRAKHTFSGYAFSQLSRIKSHRHWLLNPMKEQPKRTDFGLTDAPTLDRDQLNAIQSEVDKLADKLGGKGFTRDRVEDKDAELVGEVAKKHDLNANLIEIVVKERRFRNAMTNWKQYQEWKTGRNEKRAALEAKYGYDTKHAMHLVRLMRMATEILDGKGVIVRRPDAQELLAIRQGEWKFDDLMAWATKMEADLEAKYEASKLPYAPDLQKIDDLLIDIIEGFRGII
jgi:predicted nucleotidyltransferase